MAKPYDPERQKRINAQADKIANLIGADSETVMTDGNYGVTLTPNQMDSLWFAISKQGFQNAIDLLRASAEAANVEGPERNLDRWAIYHASASFLDGVKD